MMRLTTQLCLLLLVVAPVATPATEFPEPRSEPLDLRLLREDFPRGSSGDAPQRFSSGLPALGTRETPVSRPRGGRQSGDGFRADLPYGAGFEARQGLGRGATGQGVSRGGGRGAGGRGR